MFDQETVSKQATEIINWLLAHNVQSVAPQSKVQDVIIKAVTDAVREERFSISVLGHMPEALRMAVLEYLNADPAQGYNADGIAPRFAVFLTNISKDPVHFCVRAKPVKMPQHGNVIAYVSTKTGPHREIYVREYAKIEPGGVFRIGAGKACTLLSKHSIPWYDELVMKAPGSPHVVDQLREIGGRITAYDGEPDEWGMSEEILEWGEIPKPPPPKKQNRKPRPKPRPKGKAKPKPELVVADPVDLEPTVSEVIEDV